MRIKEWTQAGVFLALATSALTSRGQAPLAPIDPPKPASAAPRQPTVVAPRPEDAILQALRANPVTAPYRIGVRFQANQAVLVGRVGSKLVHDSAVRTLIDLGYAVGDELVIDTTESRRVGLASPLAFGPPPPLYVYPPPLFGRLDNPFFGMEPPLVTYPPWWGAVAARQPLNPALLGLPAPGIQANAPAANLPDSVELSLAADGTAVLRGVAASAAESAAIESEVARIPGVRVVENWMTLADSAAPSNAAAPNNAAAPAANSDVPPPPPVPFIRRDKAQAPAPGSPPAPAAVKPGDPLARRVTDAFKKRPALANLGLRVVSRNDAVTLSGTVPSVVEAMLAYRTAEQTPGVREVDDRLNFPPPEEGRANPLRDQGRPEDVEAYLLHQARRQVGALAHVDQVHVRGDTLEVEGTVAADDDAPRAEAALRSTPLFRGFRLQPHFLTD